MSKHHTLHQIEKVTELVNELTQIPTSSTSDLDEIRQIRSTGQAIAQSLLSLGSRLAALADHSFEGQAEIFKSTGYGGQTPPVQSRATAPYPTSDKEETTDSNTARPEITADRLSNQSRQQQNEPDHHPIRQSNWHELADFFVSFGFCTNQDGEESLCTRVYHSQLDQSAQWPGIALDPLLNWLLQQTGLSLPPRLETQTGTPPPAQTATGQSMAQSSTPLPSTTHIRLGLKALLPSIRKPETGSPRDNTRLSRPGPGSALVQTQLSQPLSPLALSPLTIEPITYPAGKLSSRQSVHSPAYPIPNSPAYPIPNSSSRQAIQLFNHPPQHPSHNFLLILYSLAKLLPPKPKVRGSGFG